jgi:hypothetical protein
MRDREQESSVLFAVDNRYRISEDLFSNHRHHAIMRELSRLARTDTLLLKVTTRFRVGVMVPNSQARAVINNPLEFVGKERHISERGSVSHLASFARRRKTT